MKTVIILAGVLLIILGGIWFLQGIDVLPGSFMTGRIDWAIYGGLAVIAGLLIILLANRRKKRRPKTIV